MSGLIARCYASGECCAEADTEAEKFTAMTKEHALAHPGYGFAGDAVNNPGASQYFGYAVWAGRW